MRVVLGLTMLCLAALAASPLAAQAPAEPRLALVIGNGAYPGQRLKNPVNDAKEMAASLRRLGFEVIERVDAGKKAMEDAALEFGEKLKSGGIGLFYYAGHGVQTRGHNYLVPVDAQIASEASVRVQAFDVGLVLDLMTDARNRANVVILDACRNNPFRGLMRGASPGLAAIDAARGTLIAYSTAPGSVAVDGEGTNSPYTAALVKAMTEPGVKAEEMFKRVRGRVIEATQGAQTPWESSSLTGDLILNLNVTIVQPPPAATAAPVRDPADVAFWTSIQNSTDPRDYQDYLAQFPRGTFAALAKRRIDDAGRKQLAAAEEEERKRAASAEAEKKRLAALEAERQRKAAEEAERKRREAEAERQRLAAAEADRKQRAEDLAKRQQEEARMRAEAEAQQKAAETQQKAAEAEAERQRKAAEAAKEKTQVAAAPAAPMSREEIGKSIYTRVIDAAFVRKFGDYNPRTASKPQSLYRGFDKNKSIAACLVWTGSTLASVAEKGMWFSWEYQFASQSRKSSLENCTARYQARGCQCQIIDENDKNVIEVPDEFYRRVGGK